jgi:hypothetical protein
MTCSDNRKEKCLSCSPQSEYFIFREGYCLKVCPQGEIYIDIQKRCLNVKSSILDVAINNTQLYPIGPDPYILNINILLLNVINEIKDLILSSIKVSWLDTYGGILSDNNLTLKVNTSKFLPGSKLISANVTLNGFLLYNLNVSTIFKSLKVNYSLS